jgi:glutathione synthase/RimK-type ligase-like ATP-grasp enzyme
MPDPTDVLLATCDEWPDGEPGGDLLVAALGDRGLTSAWAPWDDPDVDWSAARVVAVRSVWDYFDRREQFLDWARSVGPSLLNGAEVFEWNTDKAYLVDLGGTDLPVVPTVSVEEEGELAPALTAHMPAVVKPRVGAGGRGVVLFDGQPPAASEPDDLDESQLSLGPWVVQPLVDSVRTEGETSVFVLGGKVVSAAQKRPAAGEIRVHEWLGGTTVPVDVTVEAADLARRAVATAERLLGRPLAYARVDQMRLADGTLAVSELEATEPGLYLEELPANAAAFADLVAAVLGRSR